MNDSIRDRILDATVEQLRRHGPAKTGVVDVARALDMSHSNIYKHFASKSALFDAVAERWLAQVMTPLTKITADKATPAPKRLKAWLRTLSEIKRRKIIDDPEMFAVYSAVTLQAQDVVARHVAHMQAQIGEILNDGAKAEDWPLASAVSTASLVLIATTHFHHPAMVQLDAGKSDLKTLDALADLLITGLKAKT